VAATEDRGDAGARAALAEMTERLVRGPSTALGVEPDAPPETVHEAFLQLAKQFHPARFARMAPDVQRQSNEVFLALRAAHDSLSGSRARRGPAPRAVGSGVTSPAKSSTTASIRVIAPPAASAALAAGTARGTTNPPTPRPNHDATARVVMPLRKPGAEGAIAPAQAVKPANPAVPRAVPTRGGTQPYPRDELAAALDLMTRAQWPAAHQALAQLVAREPDSTHYRALAAYARGREAQLAHRVDDARVELQMALAIEPDLALAKTALAELFARRK
jgi:hypothetical protein